MNIPEFTSLLQNPNAISGGQTEAIEDILESYPYFQAARMLHLKGLKKQGSFKYNKSLKTTAAYTTNRTILFDFITTDTLDASKNREKEAQALTETEIVDLELVDNSAAPQTAKAPKQTTILKVEEKLSIGKPLVFDLSEMHSFNEWLQLTSVKPIVREVPKTQKAIDKKFDLIEEFIKSKPKIKPELVSGNSDIAVASVTENENLMTETLARVYLEQKKYKKAIKAFKILSLKYPEKSSFFADRIKAIKFLQKNNT